jgi:hypothetical protein
MDLQQPALLAALLVAGSAAALSGGYPVSTVPVTPVLVLAALALRAPVIFKFDDAKLAITAAAAAVSSK